MKTTNLNKNKKTGLGRGLGSLLGAEQDNDGKNKTENDNKVKQAIDNINFSENKNKEIKSVISDNNVEIKPHLKVSEENTIFHIPIENIEANSEQPRKIFEKTALQSLADSIREQGLLQPITVKKLQEGSYEIIAGERRWRASQLAGLFKVPAIVKNVSEQKTLELALIENIQREDLNPVEEAEAYRYLMEKYDLTQAELAQKIGKERVTIANLLRLLKLCPEVREMVSMNEISLGQAKLLLAIDDFRQQFKLARKIIKNKLTVRQLEKLIKKLKNSGTYESNDEGLVSTKHISNLKTEIQKLLGTKVGLSYKDGKSKLQIQFYSDDELNNFVDKVRIGWN